MVWHVDHSREIWELSVIVVEMAMKMKRTQTNISCVFLNCPKNWNKKKKWKVESTKQETVSPFCSSRWHECTNEGKLQAHTYWHFFTSTRTSLVSVYKAGSHKAAPHTNTTQEEEQLLGVPVNTLPAHYQINHPSKTCLLLLPPLLHIQPPPLEWLCPPRESAPQGKDTKLVWSLELPLWLLELPTWLRDTGADETVMTLPITKREPLLAHMINYITDATSLLLIL